MGCRDECQSRNRTHLGLEVLGVLGEDGHPQVVGPQPLQHLHDQLGLVLGHAPVPGQDILGRVDTERVRVLLRRAHCLLSLLHLESLLREQFELLEVLLARETLAEHIDVLEDVLDDRVHVPLPVVRHLDADKHEAKPPAVELLVSRHHVVRQTLGPEIREEAALTSVAQEAAKLTSGTGPVMGVIVRQREAEVEMITLREGG